MIAAIAVEQVQVPSGVDRRENIVRKRLELFMARTDSPTPNVAWKIEVEQRKSTSKTGILSIVDRCVLGLNGVMRKETGQANGHSIPNQAGTLRCRSEGLPCSPAETGRKASMG